ncbi:MAG: hypothetical protein PHU28_03320 [Methanosarcinaceae archaeon]|nr:hypothetical protein [Methanosarcinaceae archaeon]
MDDVEKLMNPEKKRKPLNSLHERLSELEKNVTECNMPTNYENSSLSGNKTEVRAKLVMKELENVKPNLAGKMLTSSEIYQFLSSTAIPEEYRILAKKSSSRGMVQSVMDKAVELYPDQVRKGKKRNGKKTSFLILKPLDNDY